MGKLIVIEGLDGSGKATQSKLLYDALTAQGKAVRKVTFPDYDSPSSSLVKMYLAGEFGQGAGDVNAYAASTFYAVDRYASYQKNWGAFYNNGGTIVADRYTTSNAVHQCSKLPKEEWKNYLTWLFQLEYEKIGIPSPNIVIYLDVDPLVSQALMRKRYQGNDAKKDIHERDVAYLQNSRIAAQYCAETLGWHVIPCCENGAMRAIEAIHADILSAINQQEKE